MINIKRLIVLIIIVCLIFPFDVYAYSKIKYYDFASIMYQKGYSIELNNFQVSANGKELMDKYNFYTFSIDEDSLNYMNYLCNDIKEYEDNIVDYVKMDGYSFFHAEWMSNSLKMYKYCFENSGNVICGFGKFSDKDKIKNNVDDLFRDDIYNVYSLDKIHDRIKDIDINYSWGVLNEIGVFGNDESISSDDNVSKKEKNMGDNLGISIVIIGLLLVVIGVVWLRRIKKTS